MRKRPVTRRSTSRRIAASFVAASLLIFAPSTRSDASEPAPVSDAQEYSAASDIERRARALSSQLQGSPLPQAAAIPLVDHKDLVDRMIDAEVRFELEEWVHCASLLAPVIAELRAEQHPAYERASYLFAESLYHSSSHALARSAFERIINDRLPTYRKQAMMRLLEIEMDLGSRAGIDARYNELLKNYGTSGEGDVYYLLARAEYDNREYAAAAASFSRLTADSPRYWRAQYHAGVSLAREGQIEEALTRFESIEAALESRSDLSAADAEVLQYARLGQGVAHYELESWDEAIESYARVLPGAKAYEQALFQRAWGLIRNENVDQALEYLELLIVISDNTRLISEARLLAADLWRHERDYAEALVSFGRASDDLELVRLELQDVESRDASIPQRVDASADILTGTMLASFNAEHWFPNDPVAQRGLELLRAFETIGDWLDVNQEVADEIDDALKSGFAYDRALALRDSRGQYVDAQYKSAGWWGELAMQTRSTSGAKSDAARKTDVARHAYLRVPAGVNEMQDNIQAVRSDYEAQELDFFREEQTVLSRIDAVDARLDTLRKQLRLEQIQPEDVGQERQRLLDERREAMERASELREARADVYRKRVRYGIGEAQTAILERSRAYAAAAKDELRVQGVDVSSAAAALDDLDQTIENGLQALDTRVADAWRAAYVRLEKEQRDVGGLHASYADFDANRLRDAKSAAMDGFLAMLGNVRSVALRASLGEIDVAWWQKEDVSHRIDALFKEQERQIQHLDAGFSELRE